MRQNPVLHAPVIADELSRLSSLHKQPPDSGTGRIHRATPSLTLSQFSSYFKLLIDFLLLLLYMTVFIFNQRFHDT